MNLELLLYKQQQSALISQIILTSKQIMVTKIILLFFLTVSLRDKVFTLSLLQHTQTTFQFLFDVAFQIVHSFQSIQITTELIMKHKYPYTCANSAYFKDHLMPHKMKIKMRPCFALSNIKPFNNNQTCPFILLQFSNKKLMNLLLRKLMKDTKYQFIFQKLMYYNHIV